MHARWLTDVLGPGDSLFTPGTPVWTSGHLQELERAFVTRPDATPGRRYEERLRGQLADVSPGAKQLMAELHAVHFLVIWVGAVSAAAKVGLLETILAWMPEPPEVPAEIVEAMSPGLVHPGTLTRRDTELSWLIRFAGAWKELPETQRRALTATPWTLKEFTGDVDAPGETSAQAAVLHLAHPGTFEPIVSADHKRWITARFAGTAVASPDADRRLLAARAALAPQYGADFDWYDDWLVRLWWKHGTDWHSFLGWLHDSRAGASRPAPETGELLDNGDETFLTEALTGIRQAWRLAGWGPESPDVPLSYTRDRLLAFLDELIRDSQAWGAPLLHRPEAYAAVRHLAALTERPAGWEDGQWENLAGRLGLLPAPVAEGGASAGPPVDHLEAAARKLHVDRGVLDEIKELLDDKGQVIFYGPPGTGKTYLAVELAAALTDGDQNRVSVVQFHAATTYEAFFEGLRPAGTSAGQVTYRRTSGPLMAIAAHAAPYEAEDRTFVLVIDEINRANLPRVFGDLLFLLENRDKSARTLYRPEEPFRLPANLKIIGTMNTADRSIALVDASMRRRFHFVPFFPHAGMMKNLLRRWLADGNGRLAIADFLDAVNEELLPLVGEHRLIGPSHFMRADLSENALRRIWSYNIFPLIEEQLWGDPDRIGHWRWERVRDRYGYLLAGKTAAGASEPEAAARDGEPAAY